ncbi:RHS repeat-associated core domain-containing protein [Xanthomonas oryzae]|uniref:RHS repeat-associated core domain-containing protein n=1 Tax=Xanthomonas oryzae TaxID=347 RepID=UPI000A88F2A3
MGGPLTISLMAMLFHAAFAGLGALRRSKLGARAADAFKGLRQRVFKNMDSGFLKCKVLRAEPVDIRDGSVSVLHEDFAIPGRLPLTWTRRYSSAQAEQAGVCGHGWQTPGDIRLEIEADGVVLFHDGRGAAVFPQLPDATTSQVREFVDGARLSREGADLLVRSKDGMRYRFADLPAAGVAVLPRARSLPIAQVEDACGNHWRFERRDRNPTHTTWFYWDGDALLGEVKHANDDPDAAPVWIGNVANLIEAKRRKEKLAKLHERVREYVYYPGTFVPLALIEKEQCGVSQEVQIATMTSALPVPVPESGAKPRLVETHDPDPMRSSIPSASMDKPLPQRTSSAPLGVLASSAPKPAPADVAATPSTIAAATAIKSGKPLSVGGLGTLAGGFALGQDARIKTPAIAGALVDPLTGVANSDKTSVDSEQKPSKLLSLCMRLGDEQSEPAKTPVTGVHVDDIRLSEAVTLVGRAGKISAESGIAQLESHQAIENMFWRPVIYHYHVDVNGCPTRLTDSLGAVAWSVSYAGWGCVAMHYVGLIENNLRFQGQYFDCDTGWSYNRHRYYIPEIGAFSSADPLRMLAGENLYGYALNSLEWADPLGLRPTTGDVPGVANGEFAQWFNNLTPDEFDAIWAQNASTIKNRLRHPGGMHEWLLVSRANVFKRWGVSRPISSG